MNESNSPHILLDGQTFSIETIQSKILEYVKECAEKILRETVTEAVISVPAYFNTDQREATKRAAEQAGLVVRQLIHEPTAAAIAYGWECASKKDRTVLVYDLGGGTFDVSILKISGQSYSVLAINGDVSLGGRDFDERMVRKYTDEIREIIDVRAHSKEIFELRNACERAKIRLTHNTEATVFVSGLLAGGDFRRRISRSEFDELNQNLFDRTLEIVKHALSDASLRPDQVDEVLLVGGSSRMPKIKQMLSEVFGT